MHLRLQRDRLEYGYPSSQRSTLCSSVAELARLSQFAGIFGYFWFKTAPKCNDCSEAISKRAAVKTYPLAKA